MKYVAKLSVDHTSVGRITSPHVTYETIKAALETKIDPKHNFRNIFFLVFLRIVSLLRY